MQVYCGSWKALVSIKLGMLCGESTEVLGLWALVTKDPDLAES
jgi:hypothetical protein